MPRTCAPTRRRADACCSPRRGRVHYAASRGRSPDRPVDEGPTPTPPMPSPAAQACDAGAAFIACAEPIIDELPLYEYRDGPDGR
eukprot:4222578-Prymnesium_polylepis.2